MLLTTPLPTGDRGLPIICLATPVEDPQRYAAARTHFADRRLEGVRYLHGLHKSTSGLDTTHLYMVDRPEPDAEPYRMGPHPTNIWLGHYFAWQALKLSNDNYWLILECDAQFPEDWRERLEQALCDVPKDFDLLYLGSCCTQGRPRTHIAGDVYELEGVAPQCNHGYILAAKAVPVFETTLRRVWAPIDIQQVTETFRHGHPLPRCVPAEAPARRLAVYTVLPRIVGQFDTEIGE